MTSATTSSLPLPPQCLTLLAGGRGLPRGTPDPLLRECVSQAGVKLPSIAYIGAASGDDPGFFRRLASAFKDAGAGTVHLAPLAHADSDTDTARQLLMAADLIFISGGDVKAGMHCLKHHKIPPLLRQLHKTGKPLVGLSAGSIMLAQCWVDWVNPEDDSTASPFPCLGLAPLLCDTHAEDDDWQELKTLLKLLPEELVGYGIPSGGGIRVAGPNVVALAQPIQRFCRIKDHLRELNPISPKTRPQSTP